MSTPRLISLVSVGGGGNGPRNTWAGLTSWAQIRQNVKPWSSAVFLRACMGSAKGYPGSSLGYDYAGKPLNDIEVDGRYDLADGADLGWLRSTFAASWDDSPQPVLAQDSSVLAADAGLSSAALYAKYVAPYGNATRVYDSCSALGRDHPTIRLARYAWRYKGRKSIVESNPCWEQRWILDEPWLAAIQADFGTWQGRFDAGWVNPWDLRRRGIEGICCCTTDAKGARVEQACWALSNGLSAAVTSWDLTPADVSPALALVGSVPDGG